MFVKNNPHVIQKPYICERYHLPRTTAYLTGAIKKGAVHETPIHYAHYAHAYGDSFGDAQRAANRASAELVI